MLLATSGQTTSNNLDICYSRQRERATKNPTGELISETITMAILAYLVG